MDWSIKMITDAGQKQKAANEFMSAVIKSSSVILIQQECV